MWPALPPSEFGENILNRDSGSARVDRCETVLLLVPQVVPFLKRIKIFQHQLSLSRPHSAYQNPFGGGGGRQVSWVPIQRVGMVASAHQQLSQLSIAAMKGDVKITFMSVQVVTMTMVCCDVLCCAVVSCAALCCAAMCCAVLCCDVM